MTRTHHPAPALTICLRFMCVLALLAVGVFAALVIARMPARAQDNATHFINSNYWPVDEGYRYVLAYPDTPWTWDILGLNPDKGCPPYRLRQRAQSVDYWRTPGIDEEKDWQQASRGNQMIPCYRGHAGTDIPAPSGTPVYAAADGVVVFTEINADTEGQGAMVVIDHHRTVAGVDYTWRVRYLHLEDRFPVTSGPVRQGQLVGWMVSLGLNSHLHFEIQDFLECQDPCIQNPFGPVYLWMDDDHDRFPDPATSALAPAPKLAEILPADIVSSVSRWLPVNETGIGTGERGLDIVPPDADHWGIAQTFIPYAVRGGAPLSLELTLGNPGTEPRFAFVTLGSVEDPAQRIGCLFTLPPGSIDAHYTLYGRPEVRWANFVLTVHAISGRIEVRAASLKQLIGASPQRTRCAAAAQ